MSVSILSTKLYAPPARSNVIERPRLAEMLLSDVNRPGSFALISGLVELGKTILLSGFVTRHQQRVAWVSLDEGDNDFPNFGHI